MTRDTGVPSRHVTARVAPLGSRLVLALVEDRTRERRVEAVRRGLRRQRQPRAQDPVGAIALLAEAVADAADDPEAVKRFAGRMGKESVRLSTLVQQIIELSRLQGDEPLDQPVRVSVDEVVASSIDASAIDAQARRITVVAGGEEGLEVWATPSRSASRSATSSPTPSPTPGRAPRCSSAPAAQEDAVDVSITDQGIGITGRRDRRIFERFYRVDPARHRSTGGTGLGLSIVKHVAATHGGDVGSGPSRARARPSP